ncbi:MAG: hypothetical protein NZ750_12190 [Anaerolineae bacterium]|nr:hypothetical protein [Anaerolineae bacterium]MDW8172125.1 hypothetical protein [Anaerolineae bacterium]
MPVQAVWDDKEKTIVRFIYVGQWNWDEFYFVVQSANAMMDTVSHPCVSIVDMTRSGDIPNGAVVHIRNVIRMPQSRNNSGVTLFVNSKMLARLLIESLAKTNPEVASNSQWHFLNNLEEARALARRLLLDLQKNRSFKV